MSQEKYQPTDDEIKNAEALMSDEQKKESYTRQHEVYEKNKQVFLGDIEDLLHKVDEAFSVSKETKSIMLNGDGDISGNIFSMPISHHGLIRFGNGMGEKYIDSKTVLKSIAIILKKNGIKVYKNNRDELIVVEKPKGGYESNNYCRVSLLYDAANSRHKDGRAHVFCDGVDWGEYRYKDGKLVLRQHNRSEGNPDKDAPESIDYEIEEYNESEEEVINQGKETKERLNISSSSGWSKQIGW